MIRKKSLPILKSNCLWEKFLEEILRIWERARGIWKKKKIDSIEYLKKIRKEWREKPLVSK